MSGQGAGIYQPTQGLTQGGSMASTMMNQANGVANGTDFSALYDPREALKGLGMGVTPAQNTYDPFNATAGANANGGNLTAMSSPVAAMLQARALGQGGPSAADLTMSRGFDQARAAAASAAAGSTNPALAHRQAIEAAAGLGAQQASAGAIQKAQEEAAAQQAAMTGALTQQGQLSTQNTALSGQSADIAKANTEATNKSNGGILSAIGSIFSDKRLKHDISTNKGERGVSEMLKALKASRYEYDDPAHGPGPQYGVMAQDVAKSEAGRSFVRATPRGLALDGTRAIGPILAALAHLDRKIEGKNG